MVREIIHDPAILAIPSESAAAEDLPVAQDLFDTLSANLDRCVGMAANMIGVSKCIIVFTDGGEIQTMLNPVILKGSEPYSAQEGCLSLAGLHTAKRYKKIKVQYQNTQLQTRIKTFSGYTAQIIQHEVDHCRGILI